MKSFLQVTAAVLASVFIMAACTKTSPLAGLSAAELRSGGLSKMDAGDPAKAREYFEALIGNSRADAAEAEYLIGMTFYKQKLYDEAYIHFQQVIDRYPASEWCDDAQLMKGETKLAGVLPPDKDQLAVDEALDEFTGLLEEYESSPLVPEAQKGIARCRELKAAKLVAVGKFYKKTRAFRAAAVYFDNVAVDYPEFGGLAETTFLAAECYENAGDKDTAVARYRDVVGRYGESVFASRAQSRLALLNP